MYTFQMFKSICIYLKCSNWYVHLRVIDQQVWVMFVVLNVFVICYTFMVNHTLFISVLWYTTNHNKFNNKLIFAIIFVSFIGPPRIVIGTWRYVKVQFTIRISHKCTNSHQLYVHTCIFVVKYRTCVRIVDGYLYTLEFPVSVRSPV